ncbi:hypothetical protein TRFO_15753 [Tritrichomonas foetus]|uniref:Uncharacterized protein n=1 Tax=Tritrichomonas foetus TaxID=1144522 RepID=A0A1J4KW47_9EUKA|nr:hypothetical protein TRFO_15753 [Tritrichomonas foetus]|eukprot:OHT13980.1 hypothetical protein TRFO_15753 [Tritrichomonas foetus]
MSDDETRKIVRTESPAEITLSASHQQSSFATQHQTSSSVHFANTSQEISLSTTSHLASSSQLSVDVLSISKKRISITSTTTTTITTSSTFNSKRTFSHKTEISSLKTSHVDGYVAYAQTKFDKHLYERQTGIVGTLYQCPFEEPEIIQRAIELEEKIPESENDLKKSLKSAIELKDQLALVSLSKDISDSYNRVVIKDEKAELNDTYQELLCFTSSFAKTHFCPMDVSLKAFDVACAMEANETQSLLYQISKALSADFIDKKLQQNIVDSLKGSTIFQVQEVRWMVQNIEENLILDNPENPNLVIERSVELPVLPEGVKPASSINLHDSIKNCKRYTDKIVEILDEESSAEGVAEWKPFFAQTAKMFNLLKKNQSHDKIIEKRKDIADLETRIDDFSKVAENISKECKRNTGRLQISVQSLVKYIAFIDDYGLITIYTINQAISEAQNAISKDINNSGDPEVIERSCLVDASLTKLRTSLMLPSTQQKHLDAAANAITSIMMVTENKDAVSYLQVAQWELSYQNVRRLTVISRLRICIDDYVETHRQLLENKSKVSNDDLLKFLTTFTDATESNIAKLKEISQSDEPENPANASILITMRESSDNCCKYRKDLFAEHELLHLTHDLDQTISLLKGEHYTHIAKVTVLKDPSLRTTAGRVSIASGDVKHDYDYLYPKKVSHPVYGSWETKSFIDAIKTTKQVPIDINMLSKVTVGKLSSARSRFSSMKSNMFRTFKQYQIQEMKYLVEFQGDEDQTQKAYEATKNAIDLIEKDIFRINKKKLYDKFLFIEKTAPSLQNPCFNGDDNLKRRYSKIITKYNVTILSLINEPDLILPRPAVARSCEYIQCIIRMLNEYREIEAVTEDKTSIPIIEKWLEYLTDMIKSMILVNRADDEVSILAAKSFFLTFRSGLASFSMPAEKLDTLARRRSLTALTTVTLRSLLSIIQFTQNVVFEEYCTVNTALQQMKELSQKFAKSKVAVQQKKLYEEMSRNVVQIISASDVNTSGADSAAMKLREVHISLESDIKKHDDEEMSLFLATVGVRYSINNLHVADAEEDMKLKELVNSVSADFDHLIEQVKNGAGNHAENSSVSKLSHAWVDHLQDCLIDVHGILSVAAVVSQSLSRYTSIAVNAEDIYNSLLKLEDKRFPFSVSYYNKLSLHLDKLIDYTKSKTQGKQVIATRKQSDLSSVLQKHLISLQQTSSKSPQVDEKYFDEFQDGFIQADVQAAQAQIVDNVTQHTDDSNRNEYFISKYLGKLFSAHIDSFTRNYNVCSKSTRVCYEILIEYCKSIKECTDEAEFVLRSKKDKKSLKELVQSHIETIQEIQNQYNDKTVYSDYGRQRILVFAHFCCISAQLTTLHIFHLKQEDDPFDFDEIQVHSRSTQQILTNLQRNFDTQTVFAALSAIEKTSQSFNDDTNLPIYDLLVTERTFSKALTELVETMMLEADVRLYQARGIELVLSNADVKKPTEEVTEKASASDLKRSIDIVTESLMRFKATLQDGEVEEDFLMQQIDALDQTTKVFCESAVTVEADSGFTRLVCKFRNETVTLVNFLRSELISGTYSLYSREVSRMLENVNSSAICIIRQLGHMEVLEEQDSASITTVLTRLIKQLLLARDEVRAAAEKNESSPVIVEYAAYAGCSYEVVANILLTIKNSSARVLKTLQTKKIKVLRRIVFVTQELIDAAAILETKITNLVDVPIESPEFLAKSQFEPIIQALRYMKDSIPGIVPHAGNLVHLVSSVITKMNIVIEPHFEDRPLLDVAVQ